MAEKKDRLEIEKISEDDPRNQGTKK